MEVREIAVNDIVVGDRSRIERGSLDSLMKSMESRDLINPITVGPDNSLICGARRLESAKRLGWETIACHVVSDLDELLALHLEEEENECRLDTTPEEKVIMARRIEVLKKAEADKRKKAGLAKGKTLDGKPNFRGVAGDSTEEKGRTAAIVAKQVGMGATSYKEAKKVVEAAEEYPDNPVIQEAKDEMNTTGLVKPSYRKVQEELGKAPPKSAKPKSPRKKKQDGFGLKPHRENTLEDSTRAMETIGYAIAELEKMKLKQLSKKDATALYDGIFSLRTRMTRIISLLKDHSNGKDNSKEAES